MIIAASACPRSQKVDNCCCQSCDLTSCSTPEWVGDPDSERPDDTALWVELDRTTQDFLIDLGWSDDGSAWDSCDANDWPASEDECWQGLSDEEQDAAAAIGWGLCSWNDCQWRDV
eukprot:CAMPEP_0197440158 /NCGR_PEP_ID=MMETSP1175-20131217/6732_1 /TAXON_ID=1003142 /ORGANISM="Triceratium dubium, Strain CCMP147" /LENGTH=115 /DNA_ID=CAMNT_0042970217 /DNA_START=254 /DNA_END=601 /DNA_ORIENTATION=+